MPETNIRQLKPNVFPVPRTVPVREAILRKWRDKITSGTRLVGVGVDAAFAAVSADRAGVDFMVVNNTGKFRRTGLGLVASLMPYDDANATVMAMAGEMRSAVTRTPVLAGLCGVDPFRICRQLLGTAAAAGYVGVQNFPSVGFIDGVFRRQLERAALGYELETEMIRLAREADLLCVPLAFSREEAVHMARAGADALVFHRGLDSPVGQPADAAKFARAYRDAVSAALDLRPDLLALCQGNNREADRDFLDLLADGAPCHGFFYDYAMDWPGIGEGVLDSRGRE